MSYRLTTPFLLAAAMSVAGCTGPTFNAPGTPVGEADTVTVDGYLAISAAPASLDAGTAERIRVMASERGPVGVARGLVTAPGPSDRVNGVVQALSMGGVEPVVMLEPEATEIEVTVFRTVNEGCPDWASARIRYATDTIGWNRNPYPADALPLGCTLNTSLDAMVANPRDLTDPPTHTGPASAAALAATSERYRTTGPRALPARTGAAVGF
jgi:type IV pilus biogenesis protein CpaD/CtpE